MERGRLLGSLRQANSQFDNGKPRLGEIGFEPEGLLAVGEGFLGSSRLFQGEGQAVMRLGVIRLDAQRLFIAGDGVVDPALLQEDVSQIGLRLGVIGFETQGLLVVGDGLVQADRPGITPPPSCSAFRAGTV